MNNLPDLQQNQGTGRTRFAQLRIMKGNLIDYFRFIYFWKFYSCLDFTDLSSLPSTCKVTEPDLNDLSQLIVTISPDEVNILQIGKTKDFYFIHWGSL